MSFSLFGSARSLVCTTHDGDFHCDDAAACGMLKKIRPGLSITRSRQTKDFDRSDFCVDVGGVYDPARFRYDHHQNTFFGVYDEYYPVQMSSAGLVWKHHGPEIVRVIITELGRSQPGQAELNEIVRRVYRDFIVEIDAVDNGLESYPDGKPVPYGPTTVSTIVSLYNPTLLDDASDAMRMAAFEKAMDFTVGLLTFRIRRIIESELPTADICRTAFTEAVAYKTPYILFQKSDLDWEKAFLDFEETAKPSQRIYYAVYPNKSGTQWNVKSIRISSQSPLVQNRAPFPSEWRGAKPEEIAKQSGCSEVVFIHKSGFVGGAKSKSGAIELVRASLAKLGIYTLG